MGSVPRVRMDYFYVSSRKVGHAMSTKELQKRLRELSKSDRGQRSDLIKRYEMYADVEDQEEGPDGEGTDVPSSDAGSSRTRAPHASERPMMVMIDESTGNTYMRAVDHKGLGPDADNSWLVKDMHQELKAWGHPRGGRNRSSSRVMGSRPLWP